MNPFLRVMHFLLRVPGLMLRISFLACTLICWAFFPHVTFEMCFLYLYVHLSPASLLCVPHVLVLLHILAESTRLSSQSVGSGQQCTPPLCLGNCVFVKAVQLHYSSQHPVSTQLSSLWWLGIWLQTLLPSAYDNFSQIWNNTRCNNSVTLLRL